MPVAERIRQLCDKKGITFAELGRAVGIGNGVIARWKTRSPNADSFMRVANYFQVSTDYLLGLTDERNRADFFTAIMDDLPEEALKEMGIFKEYLRMKYGKELND